MGAQNSLDDALEFMASTQTGGGEIAMLWDENFASWPVFGIRTQPYWILYDGTGAEVRSRGGEVDIAAVNALLGP